MPNKFDITSTVLEKGIDLVKDFLDKLIGPTIDETGLLIKDQISLWRFGNQIKILNKAKKYCEKHNIEPKIISLKLLCPLLENASLEEEEYLQDKWAILLSNMVDSEQNLQNHVFPSLLSQISTKEFKVMDVAIKKRIESQSDLAQRLSSLQYSKKEEEERLIIELDKIKTQILKILEPCQLLADLRNRISEIEARLSELKRTEENLIERILESETLSSDSLKDFEFYNLIRLGLIRLSNPIAFIDSFTLNDAIGNPGLINRQFINLEPIEVSINSKEIVYIITPLGELFIQACQEKK